MAGKKSFKNQQYSKLICDLKTKVKNASTDEEKAKLYLEFSQNYLMPKSLWLELLEIEDKRDNPYIPTNRAWEIYDEGISHFYYDVEILSHSKIYFYSHIIPLYSKQKELFDKVHQHIIHAENHIVYPHQKVREFFMTYEHYSSSFIEKNYIKAAEYMEKLYWKIKASKDNLEEWFECLQESDDPEFVKQNVEYRIGQKLIEKYGPVYVPWKNLFEFENSLLSTDPTNEEAKDVDEDSDSKKFVMDKNFKLSNFFKQHWSLPKPIIEYISQNSKPEVLFFLQKSCKQFFIKKPKLCCCRFYFDYGRFFEDIQFLEQSLLITRCVEEKKYEPFKNKKIVIMMSLDFIDISDELRLSRFINNYIYECDVKYIEIWKQIISLQDLKFLCKSQKVESFKLWQDCKLVAEDGENKINLEHILILLPNLREFNIRLDDSNILLISNKFAELKFNHKFLEFHMKQVSNEIDDITTICNFFLNNAAPYSEFQITFNPTPPDQLKEAIEKFLNEWKPLDEKPTFYFGVA